MPLLSEAYHSYLGLGYNIALFDLAATEIINCFLFRTKKVQFEFEDDMEKYYFRRYFNKEKSGT